MSQNTPGPPVAWGAVPLVPLVLAFMAGILLADALGYTAVNYWLILAGVLGVVVGMLVNKPSALRWRAVFSSALILMTAFGLGGWRKNASFLPAQDGFFTKSIQQGDLLAGEVLTVRPASTRMRAEVRITHLLRDSTEELPVTGKLLLYLPPDEKTATLDTGDGIVFEGQLRELRPPQNPYTFNMQAYWSRQGVYHQVFLREGAQWRRIPGTSGGIRVCAERWRRAWFRTFQRHLSGDRLAVASALVMGKRDLISNEVQSAYADTGAIHVLAVSGLHVGIIYLLLQLLLVRLLRLNRTVSGRWLVALLSVLCVWTFALISGFSTSVWRSALMFTVLAMGRLMFRKTDVLNVLSAAALIILWWDPEQLFQVGFQLSFAAIVGIVLFTRYLERLVEFPTRVLRSFWSAMAASTGAQLGTLPLSLFHFGKFPTYFLLSGTVVILSAFAIMFSGLLHGFIAGFFDGTALATASGNLLGLLVGLQNAFIFFFRGLPGGLLEVSVFPWYLALLLAAAIGLFAAWVRWRIVWTGILGLLLCGLTFFGARSQVQSEVAKATTVIYHRSRATLIDVPLTDGLAFAFGEVPTERDLAFSAGPNRRRKRYEPVFTLPFTAADTVLGPELSWQRPYLNTPHERFLVLDPESLGSAYDLKDVTHLLVINGFKPENLPALPADDQRLIIVDGSNPFYRNEQWRELANLKGLNLWVTAENGAWWPVTQQSR